MTRDELEESSVLHSLDRGTITDYPALMNARVHTSIDHNRRPKVYTVNALTRVISQPNQIINTLGKSVSGKVKQQLHSQKNL